jgi:hypothetical protein
LSSKIYSHTNLVPTQGEKHMTKDEALKLAEQSIKDLMHALAEGRVTSDDYQPEELEAFTVLDSIKEALAQPEQEPLVRDVHTEHCFQGEYQHCCKYGDGNDCTAKPTKLHYGVRTHENT